jgi:murein DD-endopeptidase MepM/ murein hydrolase activator NlpD
LTIDRLASHAGNGSDSIVRVTGTMAGEPLHFRLLDGDRMQALGAIPIDASDSVVAQVVVERQSGALDSVRLALRYPHQAPPAGQSRGRPARASRLKVDPKFTRRLDSATEARIERENELARLVGHRAQDTPQLWTESFARPRQSRVTSRFGTGRVFNGRVSSSHLGIDYRGATGEPIYAANRGVVALVDSFFLAGNVVYIDHGDGIVTGYFHMSLPKVAVGDTVERGQEIGLVGATGRVTAAHLHWSARFGALTIDPADLLSLKPPFVGSGSAVSGRQ